MKKSLEGILYIGKRTTIRSARISIGFILIIYGFDFLEDAGRLADIPFAASSITTLLKMLGSLCFGLYLIYAAFSVAFGAGPEDQPHP